MYDIVWSPSAAAAWRRIFDTLPLGYEQKADRQLHLLRQFPELATYRDGRKVLPVPIPGFYTYTIAFPGVNGERFTFFFVLDKHSDTHVFQILELSYTIVSPANEQDDLGDF